MSVSTNLSVPRSVAWPTDGMSLGGDCSPERWAPEVRRDDIALMTEAGVNLVTLGFFGPGRRVAPQAAPRS